MFNINQCHTTREEDLVTKEIISHREFLLNMSLTYTKDPYISEDLVQDTLIKVIAKKHRWNPDKGRLSSWLIVVLRNTWYDTLRVKRIKVVGVEYQDLYRSTDPEPDFDHVSKMECMLKAVEELPDKYKSVIKMRLEGIKITEISKTLKLSEINVRSRIFRAKDKLRKILL